jgi:uncharacterized protein YceH (UPF0502 family)
MDLILSPQEIRVLGSLMEKQIATPEYYPLSLNALMHACNQKSNREPVVSYDESAVLRSLEGLREKKLVRAVSLAESRVAKYRQVFTDTANLTGAELAILCVLMLRGFQTAGELRGRSERLYNFASLEEVDKTLERMKEKKEGRWVVQLPRQSGFKEPRWAHLLGGEIKEEDQAALPAAPVARTMVEEERVARLEEEVRALRQEVDSLQLQLDQFRRQFE